MADQMLRMFLLTSLLWHKNYIAKFSVKLLCLKDLLIRHHVELVIHKLTSITRVTGIYMTVFNSQSTFACFHSLI